MSYGRRRAWRSRHRVKLGGQWVYWLLVLLAAAMLFTGAVILGNNLKRRAEAGGDSTLGEETTLPDFAPDDVPTVIARAAEFGKTPPVLGNLAAAEEVSTETETEHTVIGDETTTSLAADGDREEVSLTEEPRTEYTNYNYNAYSVIMLDENGKLSYNSEVRRRLLGDDGTDAVTLSLENGMGAFGDSYVSGIMFSSYRSADDDIRSVEREYEIALAAEILEAGIDDIVFFGLSLDADAADFCATVRAAVNPQKCSVGIAVNYDDIVSDEARENLVVWGGSFDLIALDLRGAASAEEIEEQLHSVRALIGIYRMRIIVDDIPGMAAAAIDGGAENVAEMGCRTVDDKEN